MNIRLYIDEDAMRGALVVSLRARGVDVTTVGEQGRESLSDEEQLGFAAAEGCALYSFNIKDYRPLHATFLKRGQSHAGIILAEQDRYSIGKQLRRLLRLVNESSAEEVKNLVEFLSAWG